MKHVCILFNEDFEKGKGGIPLCVCEAFENYSKENLVSHSHSSSPSSFSFSPSNFSIYDKKTFSVNEKWEDATHIILLCDGLGEKEKDRIESACLLNHLTIFASSSSSSALDDWLEQCIPSSVTRDIHVLQDELSDSNQKEGEKKEITVSDSSFPPKFKIKEVLSYLGDAIETIAIDLHPKRNHDRHTVALLKRDLTDLNGDGIKNRIACVFGAFADVNPNQINVHVHDPVKNANFIAHFKTALSHASTLGAPVFIYGNDDTESESRRVSATRDCEYLSYRKAHDGFLKTMTYLSEFAAALDPPVQIVIGPAGNYLFAHEDVSAMVDLIGHPNCHCLLPPPEKKEYNLILLKINELFPVDTLSLASFKSLFGLFTRFLLLSQASLIAPICDHDPCHDRNGDGDQGGDDEVDGDVATGERG